MSFIRILFAGFLLMISYTSLSQTSGMVIDRNTKQGIPGASIKCKDLDCSCGCTTDANGAFQLKCECDEHIVSFVGYMDYNFISIDNNNPIVLIPTEQTLDEVIVSANRGEGMKRSEAPIAISLLTNKVIKDAKPTSLDQVLNKVSGVNMVSLGNEQHQMSIRQPITTKSLFLYLEDGVPVRTTGLFNHNALLEFNMAAVKNIEVIKGPSSSLYGSEAIGGVVNIITVAPTDKESFKLSARGNNKGYKRSDLLANYTTGNWGIVLSGYIAEKKDGFLEYSDFNKQTITARVDYKFSSNTELSNSITWMDYYSDMSGGIDSVMFVNHSFKNLQTFTFRKVNAIRYRSTLKHNWNELSSTIATIVYRSNAVEQNPAYRIKDDYRKQNGSWRGIKTLAHGEVNSNSFESYAFVGQHREKLNWKKAVVIGGVTLDISPSGYSANYIRIKKDTLSNKYTGFDFTDSTLTNYNTQLNNYAGFVNFEFFPFDKLKLVTSLRYDLFSYNFDNYLKPSSFSGSADTTNLFNRISSKLGLTYNFSSRTGVYLNYSEGFVPPQVTEMYTGVKVPELNASVFYNYEAGGWISIIPNKLFADLSIYRLEGRNEIVSVKNDDGSYSNQNAGKTLHRGVEIGMQFRPSKSLSFILNGAYNKHKYVRYEEKGIDYSGREMNGAPEWIYNAELWYKPVMIKGLRFGAEWQHVGSYYVDPGNTASYKGYDALNLRVGYHVNDIEIWLNVMNVANSYYATNVNKSSYGYSYTVGDPLNFNLGLAFDFASLLKKN